jgi:inosose dehydratase
LLAAVAGNPAPFLVLADENGSDPVRTGNAGRVKPAMGLDREDWKTFSRGVERIAAAVKRETGLSTVFHHHCAGYVETPEEIRRLLSLTSPELVGLVFDTGHFVYGSGGRPAAEGLELYGDRVWYMHFKDCHPEVAARARKEGWDYFQAVRHGVFCELGQGGVDSSVVQWLERRATGTTCWWSRTSAGHGGPHKRPAQPGLPVDPGTLKLTGRKGEKTLLQG